MVQRSTDSFLSLAACHVYAYPLPCSTRSEEDFTRGELCIFFTRYIKGICGASLSEVAESQTGLVHHARLYKRR